MFEAIKPGRADCLGVVQKMRAMGVELLYFGGYTHEPGLLIRSAKRSGYNLQLVSCKGIGLFDFGLIAGPGRIPVVSEAGRTRLNQAYRPVGGTERQGTASDVTAPAIKRGHH